MAATQQSVHALAHTARILITLQEKPEHPRLAEYKKSLKVYAGQWAALTDEEQQATVAAVLTDPAVTDLTDDTVSAAVAALEN